MYVIMQDGGVFDYDLDFLSPLLLSFDDQLRRVSHESRQVDDPDQFGYLDRLDYLAGVGFSACQQYMTATYPTAGVSRSEALHLPPLHRSGQSVISLVNAGANFWKHHDEWLCEPDGRRRRTADTLVAGGVDPEGAYVCSDLLDAICGISESPFAMLKELLIEWRGRLIASANNLSPPASGKPGTDCLAALPDPAPPRT